MRTAAAASRARFLAYYVVVCVHCNMLKLLQTRRGNDEETTTIHTLPMNAYDILFQLAVIKKFKTFVAPVIDIYIQKKTSQHWSVVPILRGHPVPLEKGEKSLIEEDYW